MNDVLPKPFTKDSLLGMLEKHLLHLKQMREVGSSIHDPGENPRVVESPTDSRRITQPDPLPQSKSRKKPLPSENPSVQFLHDQDYTTMYQTPTGGLGNTYPQQQSTSKSTGKRRAANQRDPFEEPDRSRTLPRSAGHNRASGKRAKYNTSSS